MKTTNAIKKCLKNLPGINGVWRGSKMLLLSMRPIVIVADGFKFSGHALMEEGNFERLEQNLLKKILKNFDAFVNVGANVGYYACLARHHGKQVIAIEPMQESVKILLRNLCANGWDKDVEVYPVAVGDCIGVTNIFGYGTAASLIAGWAGQGPRLSRRIPVTTLDILLGRRLNGLRVLYLVDTEGSELSVIRGALAQFDLTPRPSWIVEIGAFDHQPSGRKVNPEILATFALFWERGYVSSVAVPRGGEVTAQLVEAHLRRGTWFESANFLFQ